jgi:hypothetical protein
MYFLNHATNEQELSNNVHFALFMAILRYQDLVEIYSVSAEKIINDGFSYSENV